MGRRIRAFDWSATKLGPIPSWPRTLGTAVDIMLASPKALVILWGAEAIMLYNDAYSTIAGRRHPGLLGKSLFEAWPELNDFNHWLVHTVLGGRAISFQDRHFVVTRNGAPEDVWFNLDCSPLRDESGVPVGVFSIMAETTQRVRTQQALFESEERFRHFADNAPFMVWVSDPSGSCEYVSKNWSEFTGQDVQAALGFGWLDAIHPDDAAQSRASFMQANARREPFRAEHRLRRHDGVYRWVLVTAVPRHGEGDRHLGFIGSVIDITERKEFEERQDLLMREVDHRARNVLGVVQAVLRLTRARDPVEFRHVVEGRIAALARVHGLLSSSRWSGADISRLVEEELAPYLGEKQTRLRLSGGTLMLQPVKAQSVALVLHELATNAVKYGALSGATGTIDISWRSTQKHALLLDWRETTDKPIAPPKRTGFGSQLIVNTIRRQLGGEIDIDWTRAGLRCRIAIPRRKSEPSRKSTERQRERKLKVLLVEDDLLIGMEMEERLNALGCQVIGVCGSLAEAERLADRRRPDLVLMDVKLNGESSLDFASRLLRQGAGVAFCTGYEEIRDLPEKLAACPVLTKPVSDDELSKILRAAARAQKSRAGDLS